MASYTHKRIGDVEDAAAKFGFGDRQATRFANDDLETADGAEPPPAQAGQAPRVRPQARRG
jgi:hypothetical protein